MAEFQLAIPTYYGSFNGRRAGRKEMPEFGMPFVPVMVRPSDGVQIVLGSCDDLGTGKPSIEIERRPRGWAIFLHPVGDGDASGFVYFLDDGRSFVVPEIGGWTPPIALYTTPDAIPELDSLPDSEAQGATDAGSAETCELCGAKLGESSKNWHGLCPECADFVSSYLDRKHLTSEERDVAVQLLKMDPREWFERNLKR